MKPKTLARLKLILVALEQEIPTLTGTPTCPHSRMVLRLVRAMETIRDGVALCIYENAPGDITLNPNHPSHPDNPPDDVPDTQTVQDFLNSLNQGPDDDLEL